MKCGVRTGRPGPAEALDCSSHAAHPLLERERTGIRRSRPARAARPARMTGDAHHVPRTRRLCRADPPRLGALRPMVQPGVPRLVVPVPPQRHPPPAEFGEPDFLYISHLHRDHFDPEWLGQHVSKRTRVLLPDFGIDLLARELRALGFHDFVPTKHGERVDLDGLGVTILAMTSPADGPLGDSAIVLDDGPPRAQPERRAARRSRRAARPRPLRRAVAPVLRRDLVPGGLRLCARPKERLARSKRLDEMERAERYVEAVGAAHVFPCAGPPCFLDPELLRSTTSTATRPTSSPTRPCSSTNWPRTGSSALPRGAGLGHRPRSRNVPRHPPRRGGR